MPLTPCGHPSINPYNHSSIQSSSIHPSIHPPFYPFIDPPIPYSSILPLLNYLPLYQTLLKPPCIKSALGYSTPLIHPSLHPSVLSSLYTPILPSLHPSTHLKIHPSIITHLFNKTLQRLCVRPCSRLWGHSRDQNRQVPAPLELTL